MTVIGLFLCVRVTKAVLQAYYPPLFVRHGAWLTMNNVDLHLIKGRPAVHADDDLIVGHIAITVSGEKMNHLRERLTSMGVKFRKNVSVPNPTITNGPNKGRVDQVIEFLKLFFCG